MYFILKNNSFFINIVSFKIIFLRRYFIFNKEFNNNNFDINRDGPRKNHLTQTKARQQCT